MKNIVSRADEAVKLRAIELSDGVGIADVTTANMAVEKAKGELFKAEQELARLRKVASDAEEDVVRSERDFESNPTSDSFVNKSVAEQFLKNARAALSDFQASSFSNAESKLSNAMKDLEDAKRLAAERKALERLNNALSCFERALYEVDEALLQASDNGCTPLGALADLARRLNAGCGNIPGGALFAAEEPVKITSDTGRRLLQFKILRPFNGADHSRRKLQSEDESGPDAA